jgi:hypothetical protein
MSLLGSFARNVTWTSRLLQEFSCVIAVRQFLPAYISFRNIAPYVTWTSGLLQEYSCVIAVRQFLPAYISPLTFCRRQSLLNFLSASNSA